jgi:hypothetical protein
VAGLAFGAVRPQATTSVPSELRAVIAEAGLIVRGVVTDVRVVRVDRTTVESVGTVAVETVLKGDTGSVVFVRVPGGTLGRVRTVVVGAPVLRENARAVFFLARGADGAWRPVALSAGVAAVRLDRQSGRLVVQAPVIAAGAAMGRVVRGDPRRTLLRIAEYEALVRNVVVGERRAVPRGVR